MFRHIAFLGALGCALLLSQVTNATTLNVNLDLAFNDPSDDSSGGIWTVSALAGDHGLAGLVFDILPANFSGDFLISNAILEVQKFLPVSGGIGFEVLVGDDLAPPTLNVAVGSAVDIATGSFDPGDIPALANIAANLFTSTGQSVGVSGSNLTSSLTSNFVPEPTTLALLGLSFVGLASGRRRC